jgi:Domain of Unknown Function with PDB structure (DUF3857)
MRIFLHLLPVFMLFGMAVFAQKGQPEVGVIDKADLLMKECAFDKKAEAVRLIDWGKVEVAGSNNYGWNPTVFKSYYQRRVRVKILNEKGLSQANVKISFVSYENYERIMKIEAYTYNLEAGEKVKVSRVDKSSIYRKKINEGISDLIIVFPEVKVGSVIEYAFTMERGGASYINDWNFQYNIPVRFSEYQVQSPDFLEFREKVIGNPVVEKKELNMSPTTFIKSYRMLNIVGLKEEPFMGAAEDYRQKIEFLLAQVGLQSNEALDMRTSWSTVVNDMMKSEYFGKQIDNFLPNTFNLANQWKHIPDLETRVQTVFTYVKQNMTWNERESVVCYDGVKKAFEAKTGSSADINLILLNLLKQADIRCYPILFSTRKNGQVNTMYPNIGQFNTIMAYVPVANKYYILDATDKTAWLKMIPAPVVNTNGFLMQGESGKWIEVLENKTKYKVFTAIRSEMTEDGKMKGEAVVNCTGYAKKERCESWVKDAEAFKKTYFQIPGLALNIDDIMVNHVDIDSLPLEQKIKFSATLNNTGDYTIFKVNMFSGLQKNPFINEERVSDVDYGFLQEFTVVSSCTLPPGFKCDSLPGNLSLQMTDKSIVFNRFVNVADNQLTVRLSLKFENSYYPVSNYGEFREFNKKLYAVLDEDIVLIRKQRNN